MNFHERKSNGQPLFIRNQRLDGSCQIGTKHVHRNSDGMRSGLIGDHGVRYHGTEFIAARRGQHGGQIKGARRRAFADRARLRQGLDHAARAERAGGGDRHRVHRLAGPGHRARHRRPAARPHRRDLRAGELRQDHAGAPYGRRGAEEGRHLRLRRRRACAGPGLCPQAGGRPGEPADLAARHRRAGARDRRHAGALRRHRRSGDRFGRRADAARRDRGRDGRFAARPAGPPDEPGACASSPPPSRAPTPWSSSSTRSA